MKVKCIANTNEVLSNKVFELGYKNIPNFDIKIGHVFTVYSISMWKGAVDYLVADEKNGNPVWFSAELFEVVQNLLPIIWYYKFDRYKNYKGEDTESAIWGYKEMVEEPDHYADLVEGKSNALEIFIERKRQMDEYEQVWLNKHD